MAHIYNSSQGGVCSLIIKGCLHLFVSIIANNWLATVLHRIDRYFCLVFDF